MKSRQPGNLPLGPTRLIGREREIAAICARLRAPYVRLLTLLGPPGIGKTRLALEATRAAAGAFEHGAFFVPLAPLRDHDLVLSTVAGALAIPDLGSRPPLESVAASLAGRRVLLILDNFEHLPEAAPAVADLLGACPELTVLATSRAPLRIYGEHEYPVPPLEVPEIGRSSNPTELATQPSVALFLERARSVRPDFVLDDGNTGALTEICVRLEGLPLAIELAAAQIRLLAPAAMLARLDRRLPLLIGGPRDMPARQQTLRGAIGWSYDLLDETERMLLRRLSVFVGGFSLEAARSVCGAAEDDEISVLHGVSALVTKSLVRGEQGEGAEPRFGMLETIREYGLEQLEACGEADAVRRRHAAYFLTLAEQAAARLHGPEQIEWLQRLGSEHDNLRAVLARSRTGAIDAEVGLRLVGALPWCWIVRGHVVEGRGWLRAMLASAAAASPTALRARVLNGASELAIAAGEYAAGRSLAEEGAAIYAAVGDRAGLARSVQLVGFAEVALGDRAAGRAHLEESAALSREGGDGWNLAFALNNLSVLAWRDGDIGTAASLREQSVPIARETGDRWMIGLSLLGAGLLAREQGDLGRSTALYREALARLGELEDRWMTPRALSGLAALAHLKSDHVTAARLFGAVEVLREVSGTRESPRVGHMHDRDVGAVRAALDEDTFAQAWAEGRAMSFEQAVTTALRGDELLRQRRARSQQPSRSRPRELTAREREVAALIARGYTNRQIAADLVIAERTAETHVEHILAKLGLSSRSQVVAWAIERGLGAESPARGQT